MSILFTPMGESDPIRSCYDGPIFHIIRYYLDIDIIYIFVTEGIKKNKEIFNKAFDAFCNKHKRKIELVYIDSDIVKANDFDVFYDVFLENIKMIKEKYPNELLYFNISSGTPQMQTTIALLVSQEAVGENKVIQVNRPYEHTKDGDRVGSEKYSLEVEEYYNNDDTIEVNRNVEVKITTIHNNNVREKVKQALGCFDYKSAYELYSSIVPPSDEALKLIQHLKYRTLMDKDGIIKSSSSIKNKDKLYLKLFVDSSYDSITPMLEAFLIINNLYSQKRINDFLIKLCAYCEELQKEIVYRFCGYRIEKKLCITKNNKQYLNKNLISSYSSVLLEELRDRFNGELKETLLSIYAVNVILKYESKRRNNSLDKYLKIFDNVENIKHFRDEAAHTLNVIKIEKLNSDCDIKMLLENIKELLLDMYSKYNINKDYFFLYSNVTELILKIMR